MSPPGAATDAVVHNADVLVRLARARGLRAGPQQAIDLVAALRHLDVRSVDHVRWGARSVLVSARSQEQAFDEAFAVWVRLLAWQADPARDRDRAESSEEQEFQVPAISAEGRSEGGPADEGSRQGGAAWGARLGERDIALLSEPEARAVLAQLWRLHAGDPTRSSHRYVDQSRGARVDLRRSLRAASRTGGEVMRLCHRERGERPRPLVLVLDASGSMRAYVRVLLGFVAVLTRRARRSEAFVHSTSLERVTGQLRGPDAAEGMNRVIESLEDWGGGTRLGSALAELNRTWGGRLTRSRATVALLTDGLDAGAEEDLRREVCRLSRSCDRLLWLDPLTGVHGYRHEERGLGRVLDCLERHVPIHSLDGLAEAARLLADADPSPSPAAASAHPVRGR